MTTSSVTRAKLGILALIVIVLSATWLMRLTPLGNVGLDLTEDKLHTLSPGTEQILRDLDVPVVLRYYASRNSEGVPRDFELYMRRVDDFLAEYKAHGGANLIIQDLDPEPDTDAEDSAQLDGVVGQRLSDYDNLYFGISISSLDKQTALPFLNPAEETLLEYQLTAAIAEVTQEKKPVMGIMSALGLAGVAQAPQFAGQQLPPQNRPWILHQQLSQTYDVVDLEITAKTIPEDISTLILIHPAGISKETEFAIDQFVLRGGKLVAMVDPLSIAAQILTPSNPQTGVEPQKTSDLPTLFHHWGVTFTAEKAIADNRYRRAMNGRIAPALLNLSKDAFIRDDELVTRGLNDLSLIFSGGFQHTGLSPLTYTALVQSSPQSYKVDPEKASQLDQSLVGLLPDDASYDFVVRLEGRFTTAFPKGNPASDAPASETEILSTATAPSAIYLISDIDWIYDQFAFQEGQGAAGTRVVQAVNGNSALFLNIIDQMAGSTGLIGARSRASFARPFTRIKEMRTQAEEKVGAKIREFQEKQEQASARLQALQEQKSGADKLFLSPEQEQEIRTIQAESAVYRKRIRQLQKDLKSETDALEGRLFNLNVLLPPGLVALFAFIYLKRRNKATGAL